MHSDDARPQQQTQPQVEAVHGLLQRTLPGHAALFRLVLAPMPPGSKGFFSVEVACDGYIVIEGSSGTELASGVHWFLKHWACSSLSWEQTGGLQVNSQALSPASLAALAARPREVVQRAVPLTFYQNVVTMSYSMAFWDWDRWQAELDWMALQGINLPLMPLGMEALLQAAFASLGLTREQLADFFPGPAFLAWGRMGNIQGYAGPLPQAYMDAQLALARRVVERMRQFGMTPVYPAFAGFVPRALAAAHPEAAATPSSCWCHFPAAFSCPLLLDPADPLFARLGSAYITALREALGWDAASYYIADSFNEMRPASDDPSYLAGVAGSVFAGMAAADPGATWVMQAWLFYSHAHFWQPPQIQALLSGVPRGRLLLLDLFADEHPVWSRTAGMYGHPFIWCMLHNFGGNAELYGALPAVAEGVAAALAAAPDSLMGVGMTPEGIEQNPAVYEFMAEMAYQGRAAAAAAPGGLAAWFRGYAARRYAGAGPLPPGAAAALQGAWQLLARSVYSCRDQLHNTVADIPTSRPGLSRCEVVGWGLAPHLWYDVGDVRAAWELLLAAADAAPALAAGASSAFVYDLLDVSRELMSKIAGRFWADVVAAYQARDLAGVRANGSALLGLLAALDELLGCHTGFMLGPVLARARAYAAAPTGSSGDGGGSSGGDAAMEEPPAASLAGSSSGGSLSELGAAGPVVRVGSMVSSGSRRSMDSSDTAFPGGDGPDAGPAVAVAAGPPAAAAPGEQLAWLYESNLRTQLTIWGTSAVAGDSEVSDYANKEWAGLIASFYLPRWRAWLARLETDLLAARPYDAPAWRLQVLMMTYQWISTGSMAGCSSQPGGKQDQDRPAAAKAGEASVFAAARDDVKVADLALQPSGCAVELSRAAYEAYGRLLAPGCAATSATAAAAVASAAAGVDAPPATAVPAGRPASGVVAAAAAAAVVVVGAAAAVVGAAAAAPVVEEVLVA